MIRMRPNLSRATAEKTFGRKASPDALLTPKAFLNKKVVTPVKNYGKNVVGGAKIVGGALKKAAKWPAKQLEKEWRGEDEHIEEFRKKYGDKSY